MHAARVAPVQLRQLWCRSQLQHHQRRDLVSPRASDPLGHHACIPREQRHARATSGAAISAAISGPNPCARTSIVAHAHSDALCQRVAANARAQHGAQTVAPGGFCADPKRLRRATQLG